MKFGITSVVAGFAVCAALLAPRAVHAQPPSEQPVDYGVPWHETNLSSGVGISTMLGGGVGGFTDSAARHAMSGDIGGLWALMVTIGSHTPLGLDVNYIGTAGTIQSLTSMQSGTLIGTAFESALRWNIWSDYPLTPYLFLGVGYQRYDVSGANFNQADSGIRDSATCAMFPMGAGLVYREDGLVIDVRGTVRPATDSNLVLTSFDSTSHASLHTWSANAGVGYEF
jgi:hypothetical protein